MAIFRFIKDLMKVLLTLYLALALLSGISLAEEIIKPANDKREYKYLVLENGLKVILVSDSEAIKSSASMTVKVGASSDPDDILGLAHFTEHMLFLGTKKFPDPGEYSNFLSLNNGSANAYTTLDRTNYFFAISNEHFEGALDRFSQFFIHPNFDADLVDREINAIEAEYSLGKRDDDRKIYELNKKVFRANSPDSRFTVGNAEILKKVPNIRQRMIDFYNQHYSSTRMHLVLVSKESLNDLEAYAHKYFLPIKNKKTPLIEDSFISPVDSSKLGSLIKAESLTKYKTITLKFFMEPIKDEYKKKATEYLASILGNESEGSLLSVLKKYELASGLIAWNGFNDFFSHIQVSITLTDKGMKNVELVKRLFFKYVALIRGNEPTKERFESMKYNNLRYFDTQPRISELKLAIILSDNMSRVDIKDVLISPYKYETYDPKLIKHVISKINPENMSIVIVDSSVKLVNPSFDRWYKTPHKFIKYSKKHLQSMTDFAGLDKFEFKLPPAPRVFDEQENDKQEILAFKTPKKIFTNDKLDFWFFTEQQINPENAILKLRYRAPKIDSMDIYAANIILLQHIWSQKINEKIYDTIESGLKYKIDPYNGGFQISVDGYKSAIKYALPEIIDTIYDDDLITEVALKGAKEELEKMFSRFDNEKPLQKGWYIFYALQRGSASIEEIRAAYQQITLDSFINFKKKLLKSGKIDAYLQGDFDEKQALDISSILSKKFTHSSAKEQDLLEYTVSALPKGKNSLLVKTSSTDNSLLRAYQIGNTLQDNASTIMLSKFISEPFYTNLRTIEQVGYVVQADMFLDTTMSYIVFGVQSPKHQTDEIDNLVTGFIDEYEKQLNRISDQDWENTKTALIAEISEYPKTTSQLAAEFWMNIQYKMYDFCRNLPLIPYLEALSKKDLLNMWQKMVIGENKKQLDVWTVDKNKQLHPAALQSSIKNEIIFKNSLPKLLHRRVE